MTNQTVHPVGESEGRELGPVLGPVPIDTFAGRVHSGWDPQAAVTPLGQLPFFTEFPQVSGLFAPWVSDFPLHLRSPNAPSKRDVLGTTMLSILAGHQRYAHINGVRNDTINPPLLGMSTVVSEDSVRRNLAKIDEDEGVTWLQDHLGLCVGPILGGPWILDADVTVKPLYGHQEGAVKGYNPHKPGRPSHSYHTYLIANLRLVLEVEVQDGNRTASTYSAPGRWELLGRVPRAHWPALLRGDRAGGSEANMARAEQEAIPFLFKLRLTQGVKKSIERLMRGASWTNAGQGWQGAETSLRLQGWSRARRTVVLHAPARLTRHGGQTRITISHPRAEVDWVQQACRGIAELFKTLRQTAEQLTRLQRWRVVLARALVKYLGGRQLNGPPALQAPS